MESFKNINPRVTRPVLATDTTVPAKTRQALLFAAVTWIPITLAAVATHLA